MRLTSYTDYALRVLLYTGAADENVTVARISQAYGISREHLRKVVHSLAQNGYLKTTQGRNGGIVLARAPEKINIRDVVTHFESTDLVECFNRENKSCSIEGKCGLKRALYLAQKAFMDTLGEYYLSDFIHNPRLIEFVQEYSSQQKAKEEAKV